MPGAGARARPAPSHPLPDSTIAAPTSSGQRTVNVLTCGDLHGRLDALEEVLRKLASQGSKVDFILAAGEVFPGKVLEDAKVFAEYCGTPPERTLPVPVYFIDGHDARIIEQSGKSLQPRKLAERNGKSTVTFLGACGVTEIQGVRVAFLSGAHDEARLKEVWGAGRFVGRHYTGNALLEIFKQRDSMPKTPVDVLLTSEWPDMYWSTAERREVRTFVEAKHASPAVSELFFKLRPRYHICAAAGQYRYRKAEQGPHNFTCTMVALGRLDITALQKNHSSHEMSQQDGPWFKLLSIRPGERLQTLGDSTREPTGQEKSKNSKALSRQEIEKVRRSMKREEAETSTDSEEEGQQGADGDASGGVPRVPAKDLHKAEAAMKRTEDETESADSEGQVYQPLPLPQQKKKQKQKQEQEPEQQQQEQAWAPPGLPSSPSGSPARAARAPLRPPHIVPVKAEVQRRDKDRAARHGLAEPVSQEGPHPADDARRSRGPAKRGRDESSEYPMFAAAPVQGQARVRVKVEEPASVRRDAKNPLSHGGSGSNSNASTKRQRQNEPDGVRKLNSLGSRDGLQANAVGASHGRPAESALQNRPRLVEHSDLPAKKRHDDTSELPMFAMDASSDDEEMLRQNGEKPAAKPHARVQAQPRPQAQPQAQAQPQPRLQHHAQPQLQSQLRPEPQPQPVTPPVRRPELARQEARRQPFLTLPAATPITPSVPRPAHAPRAVHGLDASSHQAPGLNRPQSESVPLGLHPPSAQQQGPQPEPVSDVLQQAASLVARALSLQSARAGLVSYHQQLQSTSDLISDGGSVPVASSATHSVFPRETVGIDAGNRVPRAMPKQQAAPSPFAMAESLHPPALSEPAPASIDADLQANPCTAPSTGNAANASHQSMEEVVAAMGSGKDEKALPEEANKEQEEEGEPPLPPGWEEQWSRTQQRPYYKHIASGVTQWLMPQESEGEPRG